MVLLRQLNGFALAGLVCAATAFVPGAAQACIGEELIELTISSRACPEPTRKVSCNGEAVSLLEEGAPACCALNASKSIRWRCGERAETFKCRGKGKKAEYIRALGTLSGVSFSCFGPDPQPAETPPSEGGATPPPATENYDNSEAVEPEGTADTPDGTANATGTETTGTTPEGTADATEGLPDPPES